MNPIWIIIGGAAVLYFLRTGSLAGFSFNGGNGATDAEVFSPQTVARVTSRSSAVLAPTAAAPGDSPDFHNPNVAGPQLAPASSVPIVPAHVDVQYAPVPPSAGPIAAAGAALWQAVVPVGIDTPSVVNVTAADTVIDRPYQRSVDDWGGQTFGFTNPDPPQVYVPAPVSPVTVIDYAPPPDPLASTYNEDAQQQVPLL